eukprot:58671-Pleurochrysis_carterae.AAC.2
MACVCVRARARAVGHRLLTGQGHVGEHHADRELVEHPHKTEQPAGAISSEMNEGEKRKRNPVRYGHWRLMESRMPSNTR